MSNTSYRLFHDALTGDIHGIRECTAWSDDAAIERALEVACKDRMELWQATRKIAAISGTHDSVEFKIPLAAA